VWQAEHGERLLKGLAHITGGGFVDNVPRVLPDGLAAEIDLDSWPVPTLFRRLVEWSGMSTDEAYRVFNMGMGMVLVVAAEHRTTIEALLPEARAIGRLVASGSPPSVRLVGGAS
jgi:phosphoribosylaminoimidazole (AIR) synthetase